MLARKNRFHRRNHVNKVYKSGVAVRGKAVSLKYRKGTEQAEYRIAVVVSKKVAKNAVTRNRIRRRVFESIRRNESMLPEGFEGVFGVYHSSLAEADSGDIERQITQLLSKIS